MPKPIFIVGLPTQISQEDHDQVFFEVSNKLTDYHVIAYRSPNSDEIDFKCFYEKDFDEVKYEELKQIVKDACTKIGE
jgi:hypothetical protein